MNVDDDRSDDEDEDEVALINRNVGGANGGNANRNEEAGFVTPTPNFPGNGRAVGHGGCPRPV